MSTTLQSLTRRIGAGYRHSFFSNSSGIVISHYRWSCGCTLQRDEPADLTDLYAPCAQHERRRRARGQGQANDQASVAS